MKKAFLFIMTLVLLLSLSPIEARAAGPITYSGGLFVPGKGIVYVFKASDFKRKDLKSASIFAGSNFHNLSCSVNAGDGKIVCVVRGGLSDEYGGESAIIHLAGQIFYVTIPYRIEREDPDEEAEGAPDGEEPDGEEPDGEEPDGEEPDGEEPDGEEPDDLGANV